MLSPDYMRQELPTCKNCQRARRKRKAARD